jgi:chaperonin GroEL (HSP60 family)
MFFDGATVLSLLKIEHPVAHLLVRAAKSQEKTVLNY